MNNSIGQTQIDVSRRLKDTAFALKVYSIWAVLIFLVFGLLGIYPQARILFESIQTRKEMQEVNGSLKNKIDTINQEVSKIDSNVEGVMALDKTLPADYEVQNYIVDFSFAVSKVGFNLVGLQAESIIDSGLGVAVSAKLDGNGNVGDLIKAIESLSRAAQFNKVSFVEKNNREVTCLLDIYIWPSTF